MSELQAQPGKYKGFAIVRDKNGIPKVDNWESLPNHMKEIIQEEIDNGNYTFDSIAQRSS